MLSGISETRVCNGSLLCSQTITAHDRVQFVMLADVLHNDGVLELVLGTSNKPFFTSPATDMTGYPFTGGRLLIYEHEVIGDMGTNFVFDPTNATNPRGAIIELGPTTSITGLASLATTPNRSSRRLQRRQQSGCQRLHNLARHARLNDRSASQRRQLGCKRQQDRQRRLHCVEKSFRCVGFRSRWPWQRWCPGTFHFSYFVSGNVDRNAAFSRSVARQIIGIWSKSSIRRSGRGQFTISRRAVQYYYDSVSLAARQSLGWMDDGGVARQQDNC